MNILIEQSKQILDEKNKLAALCNICALLYDYFDNLNWLGIYFYQDNELVLGPFQGKVACTHIKIGKGVCGSAIKNKQILNVPDVHKFPGHIACDSESNSELVIPLICENIIYGVLDIDSPIFDRFDKETQLLFEQIATLISKRLSI